MTRHCSSPNVNSERHEGKNCGEKTLKKHEYVLLDGLLDELQLNRWKILEPCCSQCFLVRTLASLSCSGAALNSVQAAPTAPPTAAPPLLSVAPLTQGIAEYLCVSEPRRNHHYCDGGPCRVHLK